MAMTATALSFTVGYSIMQNYSPKIVARRNLESKSNKNKIILLVNLAIATGTIVQSTVSKRLATGSESQ